MKYADYVKTKSSVCMCAYVSASRRDRASTLDHIVPVDPLFRRVAASCKYGELMIVAVHIHESAKMEGALRELGRTGR